MNRTACTEPQCLYKDALYLLLYEYLPQGCQKRAETCSSFTTCLYIIVSNYSAVLRLYMETYLKYIKI